MESETMRRKVEEEIQYALGSPVVKNQRFLEDEQLIKAEQLAVLEEIFNANVRDEEIRKLSMHFAPISIMITRTISPSGARPVREKL